MRFFCFNKDSLIPKHVSSSKTPIILNLVQSDLDIISKKDFNALTLSENKKLPQ